MIDKVSTPSEQQLLNQIMKDNPNLVEEMSKNGQLQPIIEKIKKANGVGKDDIKRLEGIINNELIPEVNKLTKEIIEKYRDKKNKTNCEKEVPTTEIMNYDLDSDEYEIFKHPTKSGFYCVNTKIQK